MQIFMQQLINGLSLGSIYALLALGYTMIYGIVKIIHFAHGDVYMLGAFFGYYTINVWHFNFIMALRFGGHADRVCRISAAASFITDCRFDHGDWGVLLFGKWHVGPVLWRHARLSPSDQTG